MAEQVKKTDIGERDYLFAYAHLKVPCSKLDKGIVPHIKRRSFSAKTLQEATELSKKAEVVAYCGHKYKLVG
jgi:hypothetical protein